MIAASGPSRDSGDRNWLLLSLALLAAALGQLSITHAMGPAWTPAVLWTIATGFVVAAWRQPLATTVAVASPPLPPRLRVVAVSLLLVPLAWAGAADNTFRWWGVGAWWGSVGLWLWGWGALTERAFREREPWRRWQAAAFVVILLGAGMFRFWDIDAVPQEMTSDHAEKLLDVQDILDGRRPIFLERNTGREPMQFYVTALLAGPLGFGISHTALKVGTALVSLLTVPLMYLLGRWGLGLPRSAALLGMAMLAASKWHVEISRVGLRFPYATFGVALTLVFFLRALRGHLRRDWMLTGAACSLALYGYTPVRILPVLLATGALLWMVLEQARQRTGLSWGEAATNVVLLPLTTAIGFVPLLRFAIDHPEAFWGRSVTRVFGGEGGQTNIVARVLGSCWNALRMFHYRGDEVWVNALPHDPVVDRITGALLIVGGAMVLAAAVRRWRAAELTLLLSLPILLLPSILALAWPRENPSVVRAGGALPVVMLMAALALWAFVQAIAWRWPWSHHRIRPVLAAVIAGGLLAGIAQQNASVYFGPYAEQYLRNANNSSEIAAAIRQRSAEIGGIEHAFLLLWPHWVDTRAVAINMGATRWHNVLETIDAVTGPAHNSVRLVALPMDAGAELRALHELWPGARVDLVTSRVPSKSFYVVVRASGTTAP